MIKLYMMDGSDEGQSFDLKTDIVYVGRSPDNHIQMKDKFISRKHIKILMKGDKYFVEDLKSKNGTFVNGQQIRPGVEHEVGEGVPIVVGMSVVCLGKACLEDVIPFLDSIDLSKEITESETIVVQDRPMTSQKNMELINKVSDALIQSADINDILQKILDAILDLLKRVDRGVIILIDPKTKKISDVIPKSRMPGDTTHKIYSRTIVERVIKEAKPLMMLDTLSEDEADRSKSMELMRVRSVMCVPLISRSQIRGVIYVDSVNRPHGFRNDDLSLLTALSSSAAIAIENALLYAKEKTGTLH
ncbi:MAG: FHA domain-containing protein [Desulfobacteraceae bacterium]|jgi:adenylate cyclase